MALSEAARHQMFKQFEEVVGTVATESLMSLLPPVGWADVATKHDLAQLEARIDLRFEAMEHKFDGALHQALARQSRWMIASMMTSWFGVTGLILGFT